MYQPRLFDEKALTIVEDSYREHLVQLLSGDLDFHEKDSGYATHNFHSFPAKFPPQLPMTFIQGLTARGDVVLGPMMGSGTTVVEVYCTGRRAIGFDIDPLALLITQVKVTPQDAAEVQRVGREIVRDARRTVEARRDVLQEVLAKRWDAKTREFANYWFTPEVQVVLLALIMQIERVEDDALRRFLELVFLAVIITKSGGVSMALDLAHTRPHRAKKVISWTGEVVLDRDLSNISEKRAKILTKTLRPPLKEFKKRLRQNVTNVLSAFPNSIMPEIQFGDAQNLPLENASVDLIVTSPPYASNAIDYMRAHKFSLVWMGYPIDELGKKRKEYIGGEALSSVEFEALPERARQVVNDIMDLDEKKGRVLHRYYSEMTRSLREMFRVLRPGKAAIVVVGSSTMRGFDTETHICLADIGRAIGFEVPKIGVRHLDRNRRMMPAGMKVDHSSQIQQRMHEEYVIGFYKPVQLSAF